MPATIDDTTVSQTPAPQVGAPPPAADASHDSNVPDAAPVGAGDHIVCEGECISSIAVSSGHFWHTIWDDAANSALRDIRKQPNVLMPGDKLVVPPIRRKDEPGESEMRHRFVRRGEPSHFAVRVLDQDVPRGNEPFTLVVDDHPPITGTTDPEGRIDVPIPGNAGKAVLTVGTAPDVLKLNINLGGLDPITSWEGVQHRLKNLGFPCDQTGKGDEQTSGALNEFRHSVGLPHSDDIDEPTRNQLQEKHGS